MPVPAAFSTLFTALKIGALELYPTLACHIEGHDGRPILAVGPLEMEALGITVDVGRVMKLLHCARCGAVFAKTVE
jgi:hypothetical protein